MKRVGFALLFDLGMVVGGALALPIFFVSLARGARTVHARGLVCRARVTALDDVVGPRLAGPAIVRLSGALADEGSPAPDVLGLELRLQDGETGEPFAGDQDLVFGTFESFLTVARDLRRVDPRDYLNNQYASVTPWVVEGRGVAHLRLLPPAPADVARGETRTARLDADIAAGRAAFTLEIRRDGERIETAKVELVERLPLDGARLRVSMFRSRRGVIPTGFRNGIRAIVYPVSQAGRRLRGG